VDTFTPEQRSEIMRRVRSRDTSPELAVRRMVHSLGFRYRLHDNDLPGHPDLVFPCRHKIIFVHGCYWHSHRCPAASIPASNAGYWRSKLQRNAARDKRNVRRLRSAGWGVAIVWECQVRDKPRLAKRLFRFLDGGKDA
jgi:DNA mismatch endonuclease (patch repair protein)